MNPWKGSPPQPPCYRLTLAVDLDAVLADATLDVSAVARTLAAATVGLSGRELAEFIAALADQLRGTDGCGGPTDSVTRTRGDVRIDANGTGATDARPVPDGHANGTAVTAAGSPRAARRTTPALPGLD